MPRFRSAFFHPIRGQLNIIEEFDPALHRHTLVARLLDPLTGQQMKKPPALFDASLVTVRSDYMTIRGFERVTAELSTRSTEYAQSWLVEPAEPPDSGEVRRGGVG